MSNSAKCVLLADRHHSLIEGVRGLLETAFGTIFMVADEASLLDGVQSTGAFGHDRGSRLRVATGCNCCGRCDSVRLHRS